MAQAAVEDEVQSTEGEFSVNPGSRLNLPVEIVDVGSSLVLEYAEDQGKSVDFEVFFQSGVSEASGSPTAPPLVGPIQETKGLYVVHFQNKGLVQFCWNNGRAWFGAKKIKYSILAFDTHEAAAAHVGSLKQAVVSEKENAKQIAELRRQYAVAEADIAACKLGRDKAEAALKKQEEDIRSIKGKLESYDRQQMDLKNKIVESEKKLEELKATTP